MQLRRPITRIKRFMHESSEASQEKRFIRASFFCVFKKRSIIEHAGNRSNRVYYVIKGLLRSYHLDDKGKIHTFMFAPEDWIIGDVESIALGNQNSYSDCNIPISNSVLKQNDNQDWPHFELDKPLPSFESMRAQETYLKYHVIQYFKSKHYISDND